MEAFEITVCRWSLRGGLKLSRALAGKKAHCLKNLSSVKRSSLPKVKTGKCLFWYGHLDSVCTGICDCEENSIHYILYLLLK